jgi:hypothetical protein
MTDYDFFREMDEALELNDENTPSENYPVFYLPCGDIHVCKGMNCPHVELTYEKSYVCSLSGNCCGALSVREDFSTGRQVGSANPDDRGGLPIGGQWSKKVNMQSMSSAAYMGANGLDDECDVNIEAPSARPEEPSTPPSAPVDQTPSAATPEKKAVKVKRGARCVDEKDDDLPRRKRCSSSGVDFERQAQLKQDVANTLCKLVACDKGAKAGKGSAAKRRDPRLQDKDFVTSSALKKYVKECLSVGSTPNLDEIHNICISAAKLAADEKRRAATDGKHGPLILKVRMRETISALVVALWSASLKTPYMQNQRRGADSFRPFCVGVCYALKRGVSLPNGTVVVPTCPNLAEALPTLRSAAPNSAAKALHASSHRGLCTLHRCVSSCSAEQASELYSAAAGIAASLSRDVSAGRYDL